MKNKFTWILGIAAVVLVINLVFKYVVSINQVSNGNNVSSTSTEKPADYEVKKGDYLWQIAEDTYGTGYAWTKIYEENKEVIGDNPDVLNEGIKLTLPKVENKQVEYTVVKGDSLWSISAEICGSGYQWPAIASANNVPNPSRIEIGMKLMVACK